MRDNGVVRVNSVLAHVQNRERRGARHGQWHSLTYMLQSSLSSAIRPLERHLKGLQLQRRHRFGVLC